MIKKFLIIVVMVFACGTLHAQWYENGGLRDYSLSNNDEYKNDEESGMLGIGMDHGDEVNRTPIGDGIVLLIGLGAAYALRNRKKNE